MILRKRDLYFKQLTAQCKSSRFQAINNRTQVIKISNNEKGNHYKQLFISLFNSGKTSHILQCLHRNYGLYMKNKQTSKNTDTYMHNNTIQNKETKQNKQKKPEEGEPPSPHPKLLCFKQKQNK